MREMYTLDQNYFRSAELKQLILDHPTYKNLPTVPSPLGEQHNLCDVPR